MVKTKVDSKHAQNIIIFPQSKKKPRETFAATVEAYIIRLHIPPSQIKTFLERCEQLGSFKWNGNHVDVTGCK